MTKVCTKCGESKALEDYYEDSRHKDGRFSECKSCRNVVQIKYNKSDEGKASHVKYTKTNKGRTVHAKAKARYNESDKGKATKAKTDAKYKKSDKGKTADAKYKKSDKGKVVYVKANAKYMKTDKGKATAIRRNHNRRSREKGTLKNFNAKEGNFILYDLQDNKCACCGRTFTNKFRPTLDHIKPVIKGGALIKENVQYLCRKHNGMKYTKEIDYRSEYHKHIIHEQKFPLDLLIRILHIAKNAY